MCGRGCWGGSDSEVRIASRVTRVSGLCSRCWVLRPLWIRVAGFVLRRWVWCDAQAGSIQQRRVRNQCVGRRLAAYIDLHDCVDVKLECTKSPHVLLFMSHTYASSLVVLRRFFAELGVRMLLVDRDTLKSTRGSITSSSQLKLRRSGH